MTDDHIPLVSSSGEARNADTELQDVLAEAARLRQQLKEVIQQAYEQRRRDALDAEEFQNRARNTMALIRSSFKRTVENGLSLEHVGMHFCGRLDVLAHYMLPHSGRFEPAVDVELVIRDELQAFQFGNTPGITIKGPQVSLPWEQAQPFALAIHELATNALKFGALSDLKGATLSVTWRVHNERLKLVWAEAGVPIVVAAPVRSGFGQEFIEDALPYQIGANTQFQRRPGGICCIIEVPLALPRQN